MTGPAAGENVRVKLEKEILASSAELGEPSSLACQKDLAAA
jgi:hypothetical protein